MCKGSGPQVTERLGLKARADLGRSTGRRGSETAHVFSRSACGGGHNSCRLTIIDLLNLSGFCGMCYKIASSDLLAVACSTTTLYSTARAGAPEICGTRAALRNRKRYEERDHEPVST